MPNAVQTDVQVVQGLLIEDICPVKSHLAYISHCLLLGQFVPLIHGKGRIVSQLYIFPMLQVCYDNYRRGGGHLPPLPLPHRLRPCVPTLKQHWGEILYTLGRLI